MDVVTVAHELQPDETEPDEAGPDAEEQGHVDKANPPNGSG